MYFFEPQHKYYKKNLGDYEYISASGVIKKYEYEFDQEYWSLYKAYEFLLYKENVDNNIVLDTYLQTKPKEPKDYFRPYKKGYDSGDYKLFGHLRMYADENAAKRIQNIILKSWEKTNINSLVKGSDYHSERELKALSSELIRNPFTNNILPIIPNSKWITPDIKERTVDLANLKPGYYPEMILDFEMFCGQADKLWFEDIGRSQLGFWIDDYKTNAKLNFENIYQNMKDPINHLHDCNWNHYRIQLSLYIWILIQYGYHYMGSKLTHSIEDNGKWTRIDYPFDYLEKEITDIVSDVRLNTL